MDEDDELEELRVRTPVSTAWASSKRTHEVVGVGPSVCVICSQPIADSVVYKPIGREKPVWDFPTDTWRIGRWLPT